MKILFLILTCLAAVGMTVAQERAVGGSLQTESSWAALQNMIGKTNGDVAVIKTDLSAMKACAADRKIWDPAKGCVNLDTSLYDSVVACGDAGKIYDKSANACVPAVATCRLNVTSGYTSTGRVLRDKTVGACPVGSYKDITSSQTDDCPGSTYSCTKTEFNCVTIVCN